MASPKLRAIGVAALMIGVGLGAATSRAEGARNWFTLDRQAWAQLAPGLLGQAEEPPKKPPPLPFHTIEGVAGACITPMAYLANPGPKGTVVGMPSLSLTYVNMGKKNAQTFAVTQTFYRRLELGYAISRFGLGSLPHDIKRATGISLPRRDVYLHNFNVRALLVEENSFGLPLPAITAGIHFKLNSGVRSLDNRLNGAFSNIGLARSNGIDFTLTATKTFPKLLFGRPLIATVGLRNSQAGQIGYLGFSDHCATTVEASAVALITNWLAVGYEFRQKSNPYDKIRGLVGDEDNWHAVCVGLVLNERMTLCAGWAHLGNLVNSSGEGCWAVQFKYEF